MKNLKLYIVVAALLGSALTLVGYKFLEEENVQIHQTGGGAPDVRLASLSNSGTTLPTDFTYPAEQTLPKVVHIKVSQKVKNQAFNPFGGQQLPEELQQFFQPFPTDVAAMLQGNLGKRALAAASSSAPMGTS
ncbi:MAG: hypothetical protein IPM82_07880 [Saprospiraceae bacterium]|nr:hypothetical protein [Saprospiraceae bacterium]